MLSGCARIPTNSRCTTTFSEGDRERIVGSAAYFGMRTLILVSLAAHLTLPVTAPEPDELNRLDECIQRRFLARTTFGMGRILPNQFHGVRQFRPENATEQAVVNQLTQDYYQVALYLAGRNVLNVPSAAPNLARYRYAVQGPAYITPLNAEELPRPETLLEESRAALEGFDNNHTYGNIQKGAWTVALRPLRASNEACVQCHNAAGAHVKMNDMLGVALYVYKHT
jgi:hypothetical protein